MSEELKKVLIEGYNEEKLEQSSYDEGWAQIYSARQNDLVLQAELIGLEPKLNKLCGVVLVGGVRGYIPQDFSGTKDAHEFRRLLGEPVAFKILSYDREGDTFIASRQAALEHMEGLTWKWLEQDAVITAVVRNVTPKVLMLDIGGITTELPVQEYGYGWVDDLREEVSAGDHLKVKVVELDKENKIVKVSKKATEKSPWPDCAKRYVSKGTYKGKVSGVMEYGIFVNLERGVDALVPHIRFGKVKRGDTVYIRVRGVDPKQERIYGRIIPKK